MTLKPKVNAVIRLSSTMKKAAERKAESQEKTLSEYVRNVIEKDLMEK